MRTNNVPRSYESRSYVLLQWEYRPHASAGYHTRLPHHNVQPLSGGSPLRLDSGWVSPFDRWLGFVVSFVTSRPHRTCYQYANYPAKGGTSASAPHVNRRAVRITPGREVYTCKNSRNLPIYSRAWATPETPARYYGLDSPRIGWWCLIPPLASHIRNDRPYCVSKSGRPLFLTNPLHSIWWHIPTLSCYRRLATTHIPTYFLLGFLRNRKSADRSKRIHIK